MVFTLQLHGCWSHGGITWPCNRMSQVAMHMLLAYALLASPITNRLPHISAMYQTIDHDAPIWL